MLSTLLGRISPQIFLDDYYHKLPLAIAGGAQSLRCLADQESVADLVAAPAADMLVIRRGERFTGSHPRDVIAAQRLIDDGWTIVIRHTERTATALTSLACSFRQELAGEVDVHCYWTPPGQFGFGWHYDAEEVFIVQTVGSKEYSLRKNTEQPWPVVDTLPENMRYEAEGSPLMRCTLQAGDWLYIPSGYWHKAAALESSISLAVGVLPTTGIDVFDFLRSEVLKSMRWRQRLPTLGNLQTMDDGQLWDLYRSLFNDFGADLARILQNDRILRQFLSQGRNTQE